mgnify:FL=1
MKANKLFVLAGMLALPAFAVAQGQQRPDMQERQQPGMEQPQSQVSAQMFKDKENFDMEGTVSSVDTMQRQITVQREGLPSVELQIASDTEVKVNGEESSLSQIQPGDEVRTQFNLAQDKPIAVSVETTASKGRKQERREGEPSRGY